MITTQLELLFPAAAHNSNAYGMAYDGGIDQGRLNRQHTVIRALMADRTWRTLAEIERTTGYGQASISAQLRHLRKPQFGAYTVNKRRRAGAGTWEYQVRENS